MRVTTIVLAGLVATASFGLGTASADDSTTLRRERVRVGAAAGSSDLRERLRHQGVALEDGSHRGALDPPSAGHLDASLRDVRERIQVVRESGLAARGFAVLSDTLALEKVGQLQQAQLNRSLALQGHIIDPDGTFRSFDVLEDGTVTEQVIVAPGNEQLRNLLQTKLDLRSGSERRNVQVRAFTPEGVEK